MRIEVIASPGEFGRLKDNWESVYDADPHAQLFLSWTWLSGWLPRLQGQWIILAARDERSGSDGFVAFWPMRLETDADDRGTLVNDLKMAGNHAADYTGLICLPAAENRAVAAFARFLKSMNWANLNLENLREPEPRLRQLLAHFSKSNFRVTEVSRLNKDDGINNAICTHADLPATFEDYLAKLSTNTRQKLRRLLRLLEAGEEYRISVATDGTIERDLDVLLQLWRKRWGPQKGDKTEGIVRTNRFMLGRSFQLGLLYVPVVWQGDRPLAALATFTDSVKKAFMFYMAGRDEDFDGPPMGMLLHAHSIKHAIARGFVRYDFLRGNESYKYSFGVSESRVHCVKVQTKSGRNIGEKLDPRTLGDALDIATKLHQAGKLSEAERSYRQILATAPRDDNTLYRLGQLLATRGSHVEAKRVLTTLTRVRPDAAKAWYYLAQSCEALGEFVEAESAYRNVATTEPGFPDIQDRIARVAARCEGMRQFAEPAAALTQ